MPDKFDKHCQMKRIALRKDKDSLSVYDGSEGSGKSTGSIWDAFATSRELFDHKEHVCFDPEEFMRLIDDAPRYGTLILDEAGEAFYSRSFRNEVNIAIAKTLQQMRFRNLNVIFCVPHKDYIDVVGRVRTRAWAHLDGNKRGRAEFMIPVRSKYKSRLEPFWRTLFYYQFLPLPTRIYNEYKEVKERKSKERLGRYIDEVERRSNRYKDSTPDIDALIKQVESMENKQEVLNSRGKYDADLLRYSLGVPDHIARVLRKRLNTQNSIEI